MDEHIYNYCSELYFHLVLLLNNCLQSGQRFVALSHIDVHIEHQFHFLYPPDEKRGPIGHLSPFTHTLFVGLVIFSSVLSFSLVSLSAYTHSLLRVSHLRSVFGDHNVGAIIFSALYGL